MGFHCLEAAEPLRGDTLLFTTKSPEVPGAHLIDFGKMKDWSTLDPPSGFEHKTSRSSTLAAIIGKYQLG